MPFWFYLFKSTCFAGWESMSDLFLILSLSGSCLLHDRCLQRRFVSLLLQLVWFIVTNTKENKTEAGNGFGLHSDQIDAHHKILAFKVSNSKTNSGTKWEGRNSNSLTEEHSGSLPPRSYTRSQHASPKCPWACCICESSRTASSAWPSSASWR